jgi:hypothetical protein
LVLELAVQGLAGLLAAISVATACLLVRAAVTALAIVVTIIVVAALTATLATITTVATVAAVAATAALGTLVLVATGVRCAAVGIIVVSGLAGLARLTGFALLAGRSWLLIVAVIVSLLVVAMLSLAALFALTISVVVLALVLAALLLAISVLVRILLLVTWGSGLSPLLVVAALGGLAVVLWVLAGDDFKVGDVVVGALLVVVLVLGSLAGLTVGGLVVAAVLTGLSAALALGLVGFLAALVCGLCGLLGLRLLGLGGRLGAVLSGATFGLLTCTALLAIAGSTFTLLVVAASTLLLLVITFGSVVALAVGLDLTLADGGLVADILGVDGLAAQTDLEHSHDPGELQVVKTFLKRLVLIINSDVGDLVVLVEAGNAVLDQLSELDCRLHSVRNALDNDTVGFALIEQVVSPLQVSADSDGALDTDLIGGQDFLLLLDSSILISHLIDINSLNYN